jgi:uncharacterized protein YciU (UPF0263 family)
MDTLYVNLLIFISLAFHNLDRDVLIKALNSLEEKGRAELIETNGEKSAVKFF